MQTLAHTDEYRHYDEVTDRMRPMLVSVDYVGRLPAGAIRPDEQYSITVADVRKRCVHTLDGLPEHFELENVRSDTELRSELEVQRVNSEIIRAIRMLIDRDNYAPKCGRVADGQIFVYVAYADMPGASSSSETVEIEADDSEESMTDKEEKGAWCIPA